MSKLSNSNGVAIFVFELEPAEIAYVCCYQICVDPDGRPWVQLSTLVGNSMAEMSKFDPVVAACSHDGRGVVSCTVPVGTRFTRQMRPKNKEVWSVIVKGLLPRAPNTKLEIIPEAYIVSN